MWMEERIGKRINTERIEEALALDPDTISTSCPYCLVMLGDAVAAKKASGQAKDTVEVVDVAQLLARSVTPAKISSGIQEPDPPSSLLTIYPNGRWCPSPADQAGSSGSAPPASPPGLV